MDGTTHTEMSELLAACAFGTLGEADREQVDVHLAGCSACRQQLAGWRVVGRGVQEAAEVAPPGPGVLERALARIDSGQAGSRRQVWRAPDRGRPGRRGMTVGGGGAGPRRGGLMAG